MASLEYAIITWRARGFLRATPGEIDSWYRKGSITAEMVKGIFEHQYLHATETPKEYKATVYGQAGFRVGIGSRPTTSKKRKRRTAKTAEEDQMPAKTARQSVLGGSENQLAVVRAKEPDHVSERVRAKKGKEAAAARVKKICAMKKSRKEEDAKVRASSAKNMERYMIPRQGNIDRDTSMDIQMEVERVPLRDG